MHTRSFQANGTWSRPYQQYCIQGKNYSRTFPLKNETFYYIGIKTDYDVGNVTYTLYGNVTRYSNKSFEDLCSITSTQKNTSCTGSLKHLTDTEKICIFGNLLDSTQVEEALISYTVSQSDIVPVVHGLVIGLLVVVTLFVCCCWCCLCIKCCYCRPKPSDNDNLQEQLVFC